jgi:hypothetical protein
MTIGLKFDQSSSGQLEGINDAGIETFAGDHLGSLAREQGQNSLDAKRQGATGPVEVEYKLLEIDTGELPGAPELLKAVKSAEAFWSEPGRNHEKTLQILGKAKALLKSSAVPVLRISDTNTTGLRGSDLQLKGDWFALTKASGVSLKDKGKGGSYGIGKNVFWLNSRLRTVYFSTSDMDGLSAFQGVVKLVSHPLPNGEISRAVGFYGIESGFAPIRDPRATPKVFRCTDVGTSIFVAGFEAEAGWAEALRSAFAENFFVAFHNDLLRVLIGKVEVSAANIADVVEDLAQKRPDRYGDLKNYYDALTSPDAKVIEHEFERIGKVQLRLLVRDGAPKRIAMFRGTGMRIFERKGFRTPVEFAGVFLCQNDKGNEFLRHLEPPSHNDWEPERSDSPKDAAEEMSALYAWLRKAVGELNPITAIDQLEVPGLEKYLPDESDELFDDNAAIGEGDPKPPAPRVLEGKSRLPRTPPVKGPGDEDDDDDEKRGRRKSKKKKPRKPGPGEGTPIEADYRIFKMPDADATYAMRFRIPAKGKYSISLASVGDDGRAEGVVPENAALLRGNKTQRIKNTASVIGPVAFTKAGVVEFQFDLTSAVPLSLTARVHEH